MIGPTEYLRVTVDPVRLAILGAAAIGPVDTAGLAAALGVADKKVKKELGRLVEGGLVDRGLRLDIEAIRRIARALPEHAPMDPAVVDGPWTPEEAVVLSRFFSGERLTSIPTNRAKRSLVLERLALEFEPGLRYTEREVNSILQVFHSDYASLRRYLVDDALLTRADGSYWRSGGRTGG